MTTKLMKKGDKFADIFDSPETIAQAQKDGYHICDEAEIEARKALAKAEVKQPKKSAEPKADNTIIVLANLDKNGLMKFAGKRKIIDDTFKTLEKEPLIVKITDVLKAKIVEAKLKTAEEAAALPEADLIALFDTIGK